MSGGARYEIAIGGTPRTYRDTIEGAWAAATNSEDETEAAALPHSREKSPPLRARCTGTVVAGGGRLDE
jgi:hypothetical protein